MSFHSQFRGLGVLIAVVSAAVSARAELLRPKNFITPSGQAAVFIDISKAHYRMSVDFQSKKIKSVSVLEFTQFEEGNVLFDLVESIQSAKLDGKEITVGEVKSPDQMTSYRILQKASTPGSHTLEVEANYSKHVKFDSSDSVGFAFFFSDYKSDRSYLEQYLPTNLEYDSYPSTMTVSFKSNGKPESQIINQDFFTNGKMIESDKNSVTFEYPAYYNTASYFLQSAPKGRFKTLTSSYKSMDGRDIPISIFTKNQNMNAFEIEAKKILAELEADYGPWPHDALTIYASDGGEVDGAGGMEYAGATITALYALGHEMFHSYNARSTMPAAGHAGWMDEAIASWRDDNYRTRTSYPSFANTLSNPASYIRYIDTLPYSYGKNFISGLSYLFSKSAQSLKLALKAYYTEFKHSVVNTESLVKALSSVLGRDLHPEFNYYIYGLKKAGRPSLDSKNLRPESVFLGTQQETAIHEPTIPNRYHKAWSKKQLENLL